MSEARLRLHPWAQRARHVLGAIGWVARLQWFVKNVAEVSAANHEPSLPPGVSIRSGSPDDAGALAPLIRGRESLAWRFTRGDIVLVAEREGEIIGCTWLTCLPIRPSYFPILVRPEPGEWYNYGLALLREHRLRGLGRALSRMAMREVKRRGGHRVFGHASRFNRIAAASHAAAGYVTVEELISLTLFDRVALLLYRRRRAIPMPPAPVSVEAPNQHA